MSEQSERDQEPTASVWPPPPLPGSYVGDTQPLDAPIDEPLDDLPADDLPADDLPAEDLPAEDLPADVPEAPPVGGEPAPVAATAVAPAVPPVAATEAPAAVPAGRPTSGHGVRMPTVVFGLLLCLVAGSVQAARFGHQRLDVGTLVVATLIVSGVLLVAGAILGTPGRHRR